ncbi:MAG TPA: hypothetical protein ACFCUC_10395, partial [Desulfobacterales bacterium]
MNEIPSKSNPHPGRSHRWLRAAWISGALLVGAALLGMLFLMHRPETLHPLLEKALSAATGLSIRYQHLSLDLTAGKLQVENLHISAGRAIQDIEISVPRLRVRYRHNGSLTDRVLVLEQVDLQAPDIRLGPGFEIPAPSTGGQPIDRHEAPFRWRVPAVVVSEVRLRELSASSGRLQLETGTIIAHCNDVALLLEDSGRFTLQTTPAIQWLRAHVTAGADRVTADFSRRADGNIGGSIQTVAGKLQTTSLTAGEMAIEFEAVFDPAMKDLRVDQARLQGRLSLAEGPTRGLSLTGRGTYRKAENAALVSHWQMIAPDLVEASGTAEWNPDGKSGLALRIREARLATAGAKDFIEPVLGEHWPAFDVSGPLALQGWLEGVPGTPLADWRSESTWSLDRIHVGVDRGRTRLAGRLGGRLQLSGGLVQPASEFQLILETEALQAGGVRIGAGRIKLNGSGPLRTPKVSVDANIAAGFVAGKVERYGFRNIRINAPDGRIDVTRAAVHLPDLKVTSEEIGRFQGSLRAEGGEIFTNLESPDASLLRLAAAWRLLPENWHGRSRDRLRLSFHRRADGNGSLKARLDIDGLGFNSPDNRILAENLQIAAALDCRLTAGTTRATLTTTAATGEILWGRHYLDIAAEPLSLDGSATYRSKDGFLSFEGWKLKWQHQGTMTASGNIELDRRPAPSMHFDLNVPKTPLSPLANRWLVEPYRFEHPALESLAIDGSVSATLTVHRNASKWTVDGLTTLHDGSFQYRDREVILEGIELNLPIWLTQESTTATGQPRQGNLSISKISLPFLPVQPLSAPLTVEPNRIR